MVLFTFSPNIFVAGVEEFSCLGQVYFNCLKKYGDRKILIFGDTDESVTYSEMFVRSVRTAIRLRKKGITRNDIISTCSINSKYSWVPVIAAQFLGVICTNLAPNLSSTESVYLLKLTEPKILFVSEEALDFMENCIKEAGIKTELVVFGSSEKYSQFSEYLEPDEEEKSFSPLKVDGKETAVIVYSSGTTSLPKGICLNHISLIADCCIRPDFVCEHPHVSLGTSTFYWISMHIGLVRNLTNGNATLVCKEFEPLLMWNMIKNYKPYSVFLVPAMCRDFINMKPEHSDTSSVGFMATGSYPVSKALMEGLRETFPTANVFNVYSQTEFGGKVICIFNPSIKEELNFLIQKPLSIGKMLSHVEWKIVNLTSGEALGPNKEGELRVKSNYLMNGYYKMDSSEAYDDEGYFKTGDVAYYDEDECFYIVDRVKDMFKYRAWQIQPTLLEEVIKSHPAVKDAAVIGIPHDVDGHHPMGIVVLRKGYENADVTDILNFVNQRLTDNQKLRGGIKIVHSIPKTVTLKTRRRDLSQNIKNSI